MHKNNEGYADPTAGQAIKSSARMPNTYIQRLFCYQQRGRAPRVRDYRIERQKDRKRMEERPTWISTYWIST